MKINSELPLCLLNKNEEINEFDFVLFHLYESNKEYAYHFKKLRQEHPERIMILDNSAYEYFVKGDVLDLHAFIHCINELDPDYYILPDTLMNRTKTLNDTVKFAFMMAEYGCTSAKPLVVAQGCTIDEMKDCIEVYLNWGIENIAIPFHNLFFKYLGTAVMDDIKMEFENVYNNINDDILYAMGRVQFVEENKELLKKFKYVHMLGSHCPFEKVFYKDYDSMDTGYPIKCAYVGDLLFEEQCKPDVIIDDFLNEDLDEKIKELMIINVEKFKNL